MKEFLFCVVFLLIYPFNSLAQLNGKMVTISDSEICKSTLHFTSDSIAYYVTRCGDSQMCTKMKYTINDFGNVGFTKIPDSLYKPLISLTRMDLKNSDDSLPDNPRLVFLDNGKVLTTSSWIVWGDLTGRKKGTDLGEIPQSFFTDTSAFIQFYDLYGITRELHKFRINDFSGTGVVYCVNLDLPPLFNDCNTIYDADFFDLSQLHYRVIKGELYHWITPEWIPVE